MIIKTCKPDLLWAEKWESVDEFKAAFTPLSADPDAPRLLIFANILHNVLRYCPSVKNFQRILTICVCLAEGPYHTRLITGSSQCSYTEARVTTLNLVTQRQQYQRRSAGARSRSKAEANTGRSPSDQKVGSKSRAKPRKKGNTGNSSNAALGRTVPGAGARGGINQSLRCATPFNTRSDACAAQVDENASPCDSFYNAPISGEAAAASKYCEDYSPLTPMQTSVGNAVNTGGSINSISLFEMDADTLSMGSNLISLGDAVYTAESLDGPAEMFPTAITTPSTAVARRIPTGSSNTGVRSSAALDLPSSGFTPEQQSPLNFARLPTSGERFPDYYRASERDQLVSLGDQQESYLEDRDDFSRTNNMSRRLRSLSTTLSSNMALTNTGGSVNYSSVFNNTCDFERETHSNAEALFSSQFRMSSRARSVNSFTNDANWVDSGTPVHSSTQTELELEPVVSILDANVDFLRMRLSPSVAATVPRAKAAADAEPAAVSDEHLQTTLNKILPANVVDDILGFEPRTGEEGVSIAQKMEGKDYCSDPLSLSGFKKNEVDSEKHMFVNLGVNDRGHQVFICVLPR